MTASKALLTRDDLGLKVTVQHVRVDGEPYRVISPAAPLGNGALLHHDSDNLYNLYVDRADGRRVGALWLLAARSPRSLVYLPMRATPTPPDTGYQGERPIDLVIAHRAVQFRLSRWKRLRARLNTVHVPRSTQTARVPERDMPAEALDADYRPPPDPEGRDLLDRRLHADTLFLTGTPAALRLAAADVFAVARDGPPFAARGWYYTDGCNYHLCRTVYHWEDRHGHVDDLFHVSFCPTWTRR
ncbi:hypothetical protein ACIBCM_25670 [Streptomyces sp. NPDC051018]|uniref:hypothetical protein n=1 Tax=Streptomyces sp. NPDC051018 TaxID=3365639 RepID=UPI0037B3A220